MPTQQEIAAHLGMDQSTVSRHMEPLGIDWRESTMDEIRLAYITHLRAVAAGHRTEDGLDLTRERALTEQVDRELKLFALAEKKGVLINVEQLEPELHRMVGAFRTDILVLPQVLKAELDTLYGIDIDSSVIAAHLHGALSQFARYDPGHTRPDPAVGGGPRIARDAGHH